MTPLFEYKEVQIYSTPFLEAFSALVNGEVLSSDSLTYLKEAIDEKQEATENKTC